MQYFDKGKEALLDIKTGRPPTIAEIKERLEIYLISVQSLSDEKSTGFTITPVEALIELNDLQSIANGHTPAGVSPSRTYSGYRPEDFTNAADILRREIEKGYETWVEETKKIRQSRPGPTEDELRRLIEFYKNERKLYEEGKDRRTGFDEYGAGRDLILFAFGKKSLAGTPVKVARHFETFLPEDFQKIVVGIYMYSPEEK